MRSWASEKALCSGISGVGRSAGSGDSAAFGVAASCSTIWRLMPSSAMIAATRTRFDGAIVGGAVANDAGAFDSQQGTAAVFVILEAGFQTLQGRKDFAANLRGQGGKSLAISPFRRKKGTQQHPRQLSGARSQRTLHKRRRGMPFVDISPLDVADEAVGHRAWVNMARVARIRSVPFSSSEPTFIRPIFGSATRERARRRSRP